MPALVTLHGIDQALAALDLKSGTLKALLVEAIRSYFPDNETLLTITAIPTDELAAKIYGVSTAAEIKARKKNFSSLKSGLNKHLRELNADQNPEGIIIGRDNVFIVSDERKDNLLRELGLAAESTQTLREMFRSFKNLFKDVIKTKGLHEVHDLIREFDETRKLIEELGALPSEAAPAPVAPPLPPARPAGEPAAETAEALPSETIEEIEEISEEEIEEIEEVPALPVEELEELGEDAEIVEADELEEVAADEVAEASAPAIEEVGEPGDGEDIELVEAAEEVVEEVPPGEVEEVSAEELEEVEEVEELPAAEEPVAGEEPETVAPEEIGAVGEEELEEVAAPAVEEVEEPGDGEGVELVEAAEMEEVVAAPGEEIAEELPADGVEEVPDETAGKPASPLDFLSKYLEADEAVAEEGDFLKEADEESAAQILNRFMPKFIRIPAGDYLAGSAQPKGLEQPQRRVSLPSFYIGQFPVTNDLFDLFVRETGYETQAEAAGYGIVFEGRCATTIDPTTGLATVTLTAGTSAHHVSGASWRHPNGPESIIEGRYLHPVVQVSHKDAMAFAAWAGKRLPTEEEWEAAARGPLGQLFPWGNTWLPKLANLESSCLGDTMPVDRHGREAMSHFGIHDLVGNVYEWTATIHQRPGAAKAPGSNIIYVLKGGCWTSRGVISTTHREIERGYYWANTIGFRCAV